MSSVSNSSATKRKVVLVGHCGPDSSYLRLTVAKVGRDVQVLGVDDSAELQRALDAGVDLLLFNRQLDYGFDEHEGVALIRALKRKYPNVPAMLVSNFPEAQAAAVQAGALPGFGKAEMASPRVVELIRSALSGGSQSGSASPSEGGSALAGRDNRAR